LHLRAGGHADADDDLDRCRARSRQRSGDIRRFVEGRGHRTLQSQNLRAKPGILLSELQMVTLGDLEAAASVLAPVAVRTPILPADAVSEVAGAPVWIKPEMLQRGGAFKFRGAYNYLSRMDPEVRKRGVIAPSSGNHAQAVALA